jgi:GNAT superfamily N-acetyltransferase
VTQVISTTRQTYRQAAQVLGRAFMDEPVSQVVYRGLTTAQALKNLTIDFTGELAVCLRRGEPLQVSQDGNVLAAAAIYPPGAYPLPRLDQALIWLTTRWGHTRYDVKSWETWLEEVEKRHPREAHYYLEYIGVEPSYQGQGLGSCLLAEMTRRADQQGVGCYLETATRRNLPLYQRFGFEVVEETQIIGVQAWFMWRDCNAQALRRSHPEQDLSPQEGEAGDVRNMEGRYNCALFTKLMIEQSIDPDIHPGPQQVGGISCSIPSMYPPIQPR